MTLYTALMDLRAADEGRAKALSDRAAIAEMEACLDLPYVSDRMCAAVDETSEGDGT